MGRKTELADAPVLVAVDPMEKDPRRLRQLFRMAGIWKTNGQRIKPVSVVSPLDLGWPIKVPVDVQDNLTKGVRDRVSGQLRDVVGAERPEVIFSQGISLSDSVQTMATFAAANQGDAILVHAHAGDRPHALGLGSFTERLLGEASTNVVVVGNRAHLPEKIDRIMFATDFSPRSRVAFEKALVFAKRFKAEIFLFHHLVDLVGPMPVNAYGVMLDPAWVQQYMDAQQAEASAKGYQWARFAVDHGVECDFFLDRGVGSLSSRIRMFIRKKRIQLLALEIHRTSLTQIFLGRTLRRLFSHAHCPILVMNTMFDDRPVATKGETMRSALFI